jgi:Bacterial EndoU nuclease
MAVDGPYDDGTSDRRPERHLRSCASDADPAGVRAEPAETRTRAKYYEVLRAADDGSGQTDQDHRHADAGTDRRPEAGTDHHAGTARSSWDAVDPEDRPAPDAIRISPDRSAHILDGDAYGGGHRHGTGKPGKTEFPASWDDQKVIDTALDVARKPDQPPVCQDRNNRWICIGTRDRVEVSVIVLPAGDVWTAWPEEGGPGVVRNPRKEKS